MAEHKVVKMHN